jgi:putative colanic acid biosysnthesis UDP-glucose lipid carrier transferase
MAERHAQNGTPLSGKIGQHHTANGSSIIPDERDIRMFFSKFDDIVETGISAMTESDKPTTSRIFNFTSYFTVERAGLSKSERSAKRALDLFVALVAILLLWPILLLAAVAIKLDSNGPVIFKQRRNGLNGKEFVVLKFRTMTVLEDGPNVTQASRRDSRVTRIGKFLRRSSIDELPQLFNVLKGDMSVVGPRPHPVSLDNKYRVLIADYDCRFHVKPGLTGWAQINGLRGETATVQQMAQRIRADVWYINNWSVSLDIIILIRTCFEVLREGAF